MIAYERKNRKARRRFIWSLGLLCILSGGILIYQKNMPTEEVPVFNDFPVIQLPDTVKPAENQKKKIILPYKTGQKVVDYFDGESSDILSIVEFEGVYRPSQGVDIVNGGETFEVICAMDGVVSEVTSDALLGNGIQIKSDDYLITYQSLDKVTLKKGDTVMQGAKLGMASTNIYQASLKNHLHIVVEKAGVRIDPNTIFKFE